MKVGIVMNGFKDELLNKRMAQRMLETVIAKVLKCSELMVKDYMRNGEKVPNHEERIRDRLFDEYLDKDSVIREVGLTNFLFEPESPENYVNGRPIGRVDLKVKNSHTFKNRRAYFIIEFKRIDGERTLNKFYVTKGVNRFIGVNELPLYSSYYNRSCMFGFVVKTMKIHENTKKINNIHQIETKGKVKSSDIEHYEIDNNFPYTYLSEYEIRGKKLATYHSFYDFSKIIGEE